MRPFYTHFLIIYFGISLSASAQVLIDWQKSLENNSRNNLENIIATTDGGFFLYGISSVGSISLDMWVIKMDAEGEILWEQKYGGDETQSAETAIQTSDGGYLLGGFDFFENANESERGWYNTWLLKIDAEGNVEWDQKLWW